jgi:hypothetical protein
VQSHSQLLSPKASTAAKRVVAARVMVTMANKTGMEKRITAAAKAKELWWEVDWKESRESV